MTPLHVESEMGHKSSPGVELGPREPGEPVDEVPRSSRPAGCGGELKSGSGELADQRQGVGVIGGTAVRPESLGIAAVISRHGLNCILSKSEHFFCVKI